MEVHSVSGDEIGVCLDIFLQASNELEQRRVNPAISPKDVAWMRASGR